MKVHVFAMAEREKESESDRKKKLNAEGNDKLNGQSKPMKVRQWNDNFDCRLMSNVAANSH